MHFNKSKKNTQIIINNNINNKYFIRVKRKIIIDYQ